MANGRQSASPPAEDVPRSTGDPRVAIVHDYLSERGGAERVAISLSRAFPDAPLYTSLYEPSRYPELASVDVRPSVLNRIGPLRKRHRVALPLLPMTFGHLRVDADVVICSSSGWSHGVSTDAPKIVYCHNPARWIYQRAEYSKTRKRYWLVSAAMVPMLKRWDQRAASQCVRYVANSLVVARRIQDVYGRDAEVLPPPTSLDVEGDQEPIEGIEPGFVLSISRLLAYKNVDQVTHAFASLPNERLVVVGDGPYRPELMADATSNVTFTGRVTDGQLRWLYAHCTALVSSSFEDFGLTPVEAALFGKPSVLLRAGGFLDTTVEGTTGLFFDEPKPCQIKTAISETLAAEWSSELIKKSAERYSQEGFARRLKEIVIDVHGGIGLE